MKKLAIWAIIALLLFPACAETGFDPGDFTFDFDDEGYDGAWVTVEALGLEFCLPDGWAQAEAGEGVAWAAVNGDGTARLEIRLEDEGVTTLTAWAKANLDTWELVEDDYFDALLTADDATLTARILLNGGRLVALAFTRESEAALPWQMALQIVDTAYAEWM